MEGGTSAGGAPAPAGRKRPPRPTQKPRPDRQDNGSGAPDRGVPGRRQRPVAVAGAVARRVRAGRGLRGRDREAGDLPKSVHDEARAAVGSVGAVVVGQEDVAGFRAELERARQEHALALAEAEHDRQLAQAEAAHLREQLEARVEHIADLQQAPRALTPAPDRAVIQPSVPGQAHPAAPPAREPEPERGPGPQVEAGDGRCRWCRRA